MPAPTDINAAETLVDPGYCQGLVVYNRQYETITREIWVDYYLNPVVVEGDR